MIQVDIYGFGSYFRLNKNHRDIDLLILHNDLSKDSCLFAIQCKVFLESSIALSEVVMLSRQEASSSAFLERSEAKYLGSVLKRGCRVSLEKIAAEIESYQTA